MTLITAPARPAADGYWAVEVRLADPHAVRPKYLCRAEDGHSAGRIMGHAVGSSRGVHGFNYYRLHLPIANRASAGLPALGGYETVRPEDWADLMLAHAASEATLHGKPAAGVKPSAPRKTKGAPHAG